MIKAKRIYSVGLLLSVVMFAMGGPAHADVGKVKAAAVKIKPVDDGMSKAKVISDGVSVKDQGGHWEGMVYPTNKGINLPRLKNGEKLPVMVGN